MLGDEVDVISSAALFLLQSASSHNSIHRSAWHSECMKSYCYYFHPTAFQSSTSSSPLQDIRSLWYYHYYSQPWMASYSRSIHLSNTTPTTDPHYQHHLYLNQQHFSFANSLATWPSHRSASINSNPIRTRSHTRPPTTISTHSLTKITLDVISIERFILLAKIANTANASKATVAP